MTEWTVVTVIIAIIGLLGAVMKPLLSLNSTITRLCKSVDSLETQLTKIVDKNSEAHGRMWQQIDEQEKRIRCCEVWLGVKQKT